MMAAETIQQGRAVLGIELGSTRIKAVLVDEVNAVLATGSHEWENRYEGGHWTYHEDEIWSGLAACYADLKADVLARYGVTLAQLGALGVSAMMHGYLALDADGKLLVPFRTWRDTTTTVAAQELSALFEFHVPERWSVSHVYQAILDGEEHVPSISRLTTLAGLVHLRLTGEHVLSVGDASGMFPIDSATRGYDDMMLRKFDGISATHGVPWTLAELLPRIALAGEEAGRLTPEGAILLDPSGDLQAGCPLCPPEGDAGTGMIATNSVAPGTGNVSAGTSVFSMVVLERPLADRTAPEIDLVTTPCGDEVAMVHCNNCTSDINAYVGLLCEFAEVMSVPVDRGEAFTKLFNLALSAEPDAGGVTAMPFVSGETIMGVSEGRPLLMREPGVALTLPRLMRASVMGAFAALAAGNEAIREQGVRIGRITGHGGIFKTPLVAQRLLAAALDAPVVVMETAGEGGAWGQAVAANYLLHGRGRSLSTYLSEEVFSDMRQQLVEPSPADVEGFASYLACYRRGCVACKALEVR